MNALVEEREGRLFEPFIDPVDMVAVFGADLPLREIRSRVAREGLRFPLGCDEKANLREHLSAVEYASGSARFGPFCDNLLGMNWRLPDGRLVRIGERVVKTTTGYDLQRFLLHMGPEAGRAEQLVLRLRPDGARTVEGVYVADGRTLSAIGRELRRSPWAHWLDSVDVVMVSESARLEVSANCLDGEEPLYVDYLSRIGQGYGCPFERVSLEKDAGLPAYCVKCLSSEASLLAAQQLEQHGGKARVLYFNAYILFWPEAEVDEERLRPLRTAVTQGGGHVFGKAGAAAPRAGEAQWLKTLISSWGGR